MMTSRKELAQRLYHDIIRRESGFSIMTQELVTDYRRHAEELTIKWMMESLSRGNRRCVRYLERYKNTPERVEFECDISPESLGLLKTIIAIHSDMSLVEALATVRAIEAIERSVDGTT